VLDEHHQPTEAIKDKEKFHRLDALRYAVQGLTAPEAASAETPPEETLADRRLMEKLAAGFPGRLTHRW
jgi:hypothetical protein